jgi:Transposase DDE domain
MNHTRSPHLSRRGSGGICPQSAFIGWLEELLRQVFAPAAEHSRKRGRPLSLTEPHLWLCLLVGVLHGAHSFQAFWRLLVVEPLGSFPLLSITDEAVRKRLRALAPGACAQLYQRLCDLLPRPPISQSTLPLACFAAEVGSLDESTMEALARSQAELRSLSSEDPQLVAGKLAGLWDVRRQRWLRLQFRADALAGCSLDLEPLLQALPIGSLILEDLGYFGFPWLDQLSQLGYWFVSRLRTNGSYVIRHVFAQDPTCDLLDALIWLGAYRSDQAAYAVRLLQYRYEGKLYRYITNVLDPTLLPLDEVVQLYARRWDIELVFSLLKEQLGLHVFWSAIEELVLLQVWAAIILAQVLASLRFQIAEAAEVDLFDVSLEILIDLLKRLAHSPRPLLGRLVQRGRFWKLIRPHSRHRRDVARVAQEQITPLPADTILIRPARYAHRNPHPRKIIFTPRFTTRLLIELDQMDKCGPYRFLH